MGIGQHEIEETIVRTLYDGWFQNNLIVHLVGLRDEKGWDRITYDKAISRLVELSLIRAMTGNEGYSLQPQGIIYAENEGIASPSQIEACRHLRTRLLALLGTVYDEQGPWAYENFQQLAADTDSDAHFVLHNLQLLNKLGYIEPVASSGFKLSHQGLDAVAQWHQQNALAQELEEISKLKPHPRGRALQKLFARRVEQDGWSQAESVRTSHEEMDVVVWRGREYYLVECKWESKRIEAAVVRELHGKLSNRVGVRGIIVSMSGFTQGATQQVKDHAGSNIILLFGPEDVRSLLRHEVTFDALLDEKYGKLVMKRDVVWS